MALSDKDIKLLNSKIGIMNLLRSTPFGVEKALRYARYEQELKKAQAEMVKLQEWVIENNKRVIIIFEGRDAAGKGGAIRRITAHINPRYYNVVALPKPTEEEAQQWFFQRYVTHFPKPGHMIFFDRSWYNRAMVEPVMGFCTQDQYERFMEQVNHFEQMLTDSGAYLIKIYLSITKLEQKRRFEDIQSSTLKRWKMTPLDAKAHELWDEYTKYKQRMFEHTNTTHAPWKIIKANRKTVARMQSIKHILRSIPYK